ncbi:hypothetical protein ACQR1H_33180 [Bradyrhizobium sp. HKCCYLRH2015]|uniref:hypothetical protein n=1 Tax=Bradyrhizobium sp. HKCCYLRH2015 TaxID=3420742 RepID=UPI003EBF12FF
MRLPVDRASCWEGGNRGGEEAKAQELHDQFENDNRAIKEQIFKMIGRNISLWSRLEGHLVYVAAFLLDVPADKAGLIFYSINSFPTWIQIIDELFVLETQFSVCQNSWSAIRSRLLKLNGKRVRMAHHFLQGGEDLSDIMKLSDAELESDEVYPSLKPHRLDTRAKWKQPALGVSEIASFPEEILCVSEAMSELLDKMEPIYFGPKRAVTAIMEQHLKKQAEQQPPVPQATTKGRAEE